jgi:hypothetical protein
MRLQCMVADERRIARPLAQPEAMADGWLPAFRECDVDAQRDKLFHKR